MTRATPSRGWVLLAFAAVYLIWGSTYLAILFAIETLPGFLMAGVRYLVAGAVLLAVARARGAPRPRGEHWRSAAVVGVLLIMLGNGGVVWAEYRVPSGVAALLIATVPLWMVLGEWLRPGGRRPGLPVFAGLLLGLVGLGMLLGPDALAGGARVDPLGALALAVASISWATGSLYSRQAPTPSSPLLAIGMQQFAGGAALVVLSGLTGEMAQVDPSAISLPSTLALLYLIVFGSIVGFSAYMWLLQVSTPEKVSTYAYVNPVVAVLLGWAFAGEAITMRLAAGAAVILAGVALITLAPRLRRAPGPAPARGTGAAPVLGPASPRR